MQAADGKIQFIAQGLKRFRIESWSGSRRHSWLEFNIDRTEEEDENQIRAGRSMINIIKELASLNPCTEELKHYLNYLRRMNHRR